MTGSCCRRRALQAGAVFLVSVTVGCSDARGADSLAISGSSTVAPITEAVAADGNFTVDVTPEGTTDGFARFCAGETVINNASTPIPGAGQNVDYVQMCEDNAVTFVELPIALDALTVVRHRDASFADDLSLEELRAIWAPDSTVATWHDVRADWPDRPLNLYGRPEGSGTFEYFTHHVVGQAGQIRADYDATDDLAELAGWLADDEDGLGFMGVGNYLAADEDARDLIANVAVDGVEPTRIDAQSGRYQPLTRPLLLYVSLAALEEDPVVEEFITHYLESVVELLPRVYFYALPDEVYAASAARLAEREPGTRFGGDPFAAVDELGLSQDAAS